MRLPSPSLPSSSGFLLCFFLPLSARAQSTVGSKTWLLSSACGQASEPAGTRQPRHATHPETVSSLDARGSEITAPHPHGSSVITGRSFASTPAGLGRVRLRGVPCCRGPEGGSAICTRCRCRRRRRCCHANTVAKVNAEWIACHVPPLPCPITCPRHHR